jgi:hypothetical protein
VSNLWLFNDNQARIISKILSAKELVLIKDIDDYMDAASQEVFGCDYLD